MIISPPFLPERLASETDDQFVDRAMPGGTPGDGGFPVSFEMNWHGGIHLTAPVEAGSPLPVRAIADGTVVFVRAPSPHSADPKHALNYRGSCTDDGCVIVKHETDIGAAPGTGQPTKVVFFSIQMHLGAIAKGVAQGQRIFRKDEIGRAGQIYGAPNRIHFEIVCDDANIAPLVGRTETYAPVGADGRVDAVYGSIYFLLLVGTQFLDARPGSSPTPPRVLYQNDEAHFVRMSFVGGDCVFETLHLDGRPIGGAFTEPNFGYELVEMAVKQYPQSPSAGLELLRFGRVLGPDPLVPPNAPHWRQVPSPSGNGWVNLNAPNVRKFSDADFPHWDRWWMLVDGAASTDSRCIDVKVLQLLDDNHDLNVTPQEAATRLADPDVQARVTRKICKFHTEWDEGTVDARYGWLKREPHTRMTETDYSRFKAHATALAFWQKAALGVDAKCWHFHPTLFIKHFRRCLWLSESEVAQCVPRKIAELHGTNFATPTIAAWAVATTRAHTWARHINTSVRRYLISETAPRLVHFLAQVLAESGFLRHVVEGGAAGATYAPYYGRGLIQLTHLGNYQTYGNYRRFPTAHPNAAPPFAALGWNPDDLIARTDTNYVAVNAADSAGFYWTCPTITAIGANGLSVSDNGQALTDCVAASRLTNGRVAIENLNGLDFRLSSFFYLKYLLLDGVRPSSNVEQATFDWRRNSHREPVLDAAGNPVLNTNGTPKTHFVRGPHTVDFPLNHQRP